MATTTNRYLVFPVLATGPTVATGAAAWTWTGWTQLVPANTIAATFYICALSTLEFPTAAVDVKMQTHFSLGVGAAGSEIEIIQWTMTWMIDSAVGHLYAPNLTIPEPKQVAANSRVAVRVAHSVALASTFGPFAIQYQTA